MFERDGDSPTSRIIFAAEGSITYKWKQEEDVDHREEELATQADGPHKRRMPTHGLTKHVLILCGAIVPQGRAPRGNLARQLLEALPKAEEGTGTGASPMAPSNQALCREDCWKDGGTSNNKKRTRVWTGCVVDQSCPIIRLIYWRYTRQLFLFPVASYDISVREGRFCFRFLRAAAFFFAGSSHHVTLADIFFFVPERCSCRDGGGKKATGKESGRSRGHGKSKTSGRQMRSYLRS